MDSLEKLQELRRLIEQEGYKVEGFCLKPGVEEPRKHLQVIAERELTSEEIKAFQSIDWQVITDIRLVER